MILRLATLLTLLAAYVSADDNPFDCKPTVDKLSYDLTKLNQEFTVSWTVKASQSTNNETLRFNLCDDLKKQDKVLDDCPSGTRACLTTTNKKEKEDDRVLYVVPLATSDSLKPELSASSSPKGLNVTLHGPKYPSRTDPNVETPQSLVVLLECAPKDEEKPPSYVSHDGATVTLGWKHPAGCGFEGDKPPPKDDDKTDDDKKDNNNKDAATSVGSGIGFFFLVVLLAFAAYFGVGAYYNYTTYGARGLDLIPHRDFWQEVPFMLRDIASHLCTSFTGSRRPSSSSRGGYISV